MKERERKREREREKKVRERDMDGLGTVTRITNTLVNTTQSPQVLNGLSPVQGKTTH